MSTIPLKTETDIYNKILIDLKADSVKGLATYKNSAVDNIFIEPLKYQAYEAYIIADFADKIGNLADLRNISNSITYQNTLRFILNLTLTEVKALISTAIDNLAANWNKARTQERASRGYLRINFSSADPVTLPSGVVASTLDGLTFSTKNAFINFVPEYDALEGSYFIDIFAECDTAGEIGNVEEGSIISLVTNVTNAISCVNLTKFQFGRNLEDDNTFIDRLQGSWQSRRVSLFQGIKDMLSEYPGIKDSSIVIHGSVEQVRNEKNAVDIFLISEVRNQLKEDIFHGDMAVYAWERINDEINFNTYSTNIPIGYQYYKLKSQPALSLASVSYGSTSTGPWTALGVSDYELVRDFSSNFAQSVRGHDYVKVNVTNLPSPYYIKINYTYNRLYKDLQTLILNYENYSIGSDILFKEGKELTVDIEVSMSLFSGYSTLQVQGYVTSNLTAFLNGGTDLNETYWSPFKLGQYIDKSDIVDRIIETEGVDYIDVDNFKVTIDGETDWSRYSPIFSNYLRLGTITFTKI